MSSSQRKVLPGDAILCQGDRTTGSLLLPASAPEEFVAQFNRVYASIGLVLQMRTSLSINEKTPAASQDAAEGS